MCGAIREDDVVDNDVAPSRRAVVIVDDLDGGLLALVLRDVPGDPVHVAAVVAGGGGDDLAVDEQVDRGGVRLAHRVITTGDEEVDVVGADGERWGGDSALGRIAGYDAGVEDPRAYLPGQVFSCRAGEREVARGGPTGAPSAAFEVGEDCPFRHCAVGDGACDVWVIPATDEEVDVRPADGERR